MLLVATGELPVDFTRIRSRMRTVRTVGCSFMWAFDLLTMFAELFDVKFVLSRLHALFKLHIYTLFSGVDCPLIALEMIRGAGLGYGVLQLQHEDRRYCGQLRKAFLARHG